jgi:hypothetical protein
MNQPTEENKITYTDMINYIHTYSTNPNTSPYDFTGVVHLMLAALDNLQMYGCDAELENIGYCLTDTQRMFLKKVAEYACQITDADIDHDDTIVENG